MSELHCPRPFVVFRPDETTAPFKTVAAIRVVVLPSIDSTFLARLL